MLTLESFEEAAAKVKEVTQETKLIYSSYFSDMTGNKVYLKPENMQRTGAYKVRGAYYKISTLSDEERNKGLITNVFSRSIGNFEMQDIMNLMESQKGTLRAFRTIFPNCP